MANVRVDFPRPDSPRHDTVNVLALSSTALTTPVARRQSLDPTTHPRGYHLPHTRSPTPRTPKAPGSLWARAAKASLISSTLRPAAKTFPGIETKRDNNASLEARGVRGADVQCTHSLPSQLIAKLSSNSIANPTSGKRNQWPSNVPARGSCRTHTAKDRAASPTSRCGGFARLQDASPQQASPPAVGAFGALSISSNPTSRPGGRWGESERHGHTQVS